MRAIRASRLCDKHYKAREYRQKRDAAPVTSATCPHCAATFDQPRTGRPSTYCTVRCRDDAKYARRRAVRAVDRVERCEWCGKGITRMRSDAKYCSDYCANRIDYRENRERIRASSRAWAEANSDRVKATTARYVAENWERIYARKKAWQVANAAHHRDYQRRYQLRYAQEHPERRRLHTANRVGRKRQNGGGALVISRRDWQRLLVIYRHRCAYCEQPGRLELEHVIPLSRGGRHSLGNIVPACRPCNASKNDRLLIEWRNGIPRRRKRRVDPL